MHNMIVFCIVVHHLHRPNGRRFTLGARGRSHCGTAKPSSLIDKPLRTVSTRRYPSTPWDVRQRRRRPEF
eukprot:1954253-Pyramimonas_sp.AAC.1